MEKVQSKFRALYRFIVFILLVLGYLAKGFIIHWTVKNADERRRRFMWLAHSTIVVILKKFNITVEVKNPPPSEDVCLLVGNHIGFIDILSIASTGPICFVTSKEMHETPVLGLLTEMGGCMYVERRRRANIVNEMQEMAAEMRKGFRVLLYPEATSTNGEQVLPFKKTLIMSAAYAGCPIRPYVFNFKSVNNGEVEFKHQDYLCWYGDQSFVGALWRSLQLNSLHVEIEFLEPIFPNVDDDRGVIARKAHHAVASKFRPFVNPFRDLEALG